MHWKTHAVIGANTVWAAAAVVEVDDFFLPLFAIGAFAALVPDIDATRAKIHFVGGGVMGAFRNVFRHRGFFHSLLATTIIGVLSVFFLTKYHAGLPIVITLAYCSHAIIDGFNYPGVEYLFPYKKRIRLVPKFLASPVNGGADQLFFILGIGGILFFLLQHSGLFLETSTLI